MKKYFNLLLDIMECAYIMKTSSCMLRKNYNKAFTVQCMFVFVIIKISLAIPLSHIIWQKINTSINEVLTI